MIETEGKAAGGRWPAKRFSVWVRCGAVAKRDECRMPMR